LAWMRKVESRVERGFSKLFGRSSNKNVQPAELSLMLAKELEGHTKVIRSRTYAPNFYAVYLCEKDRAYYRSTEGALTKQLEGRLLQHVQTSGYNLLAKPEVEILTDPDLGMGQFGVRAELRDPGSGHVFVDGRGQAESKAVVAGAVAADAAAAGPPKRSEPVRPVPEPEPQVVVLRRDGRSKEFSQPRVILGRSRDADYRVNDPNVSRRHAMIYWEDGRLYLKDLGSTNGTLLNGRPVSTGLLASGDTISVGGIGIVVETG
jgi:hypothetical protein